MKRFKFFHSNPKKFTPVEELSFGEKLFFFHKQDEEGMIVRDGFNGDLIFIIIFILLFLISLIFLIVTDIAILFF